MFRHNYLNSSLQSTHQEVDLALKSPSIEVNNGLDFVTLFRRLSKLLRKPPNLLIFWVVNLYITARYSHSPSQQNYNQGIVHIKSLSDKQQQIKGLPNAFLSPSSKNKKKIKKFTLKNFLILSQKKVFLIVWENGTVKF